MKKRFKKWMPLVLSLLLVITTGTSIRANDDGTLAEMTPMDDVSVVQTLMNDDEIEEEPIAVASDRSEPVDIIVELEARPILDYENEISQVGSIGDFSETKQAQDIEADLIQSHETIVEKIAETIQKDVEVESNFTRVMNGFSLKASLDDLALIKDIEGVKSAFVSQTYQIPEPQMVDSNRTIGADTIWTQSHYKGENIVVAVLDTGLDTGHPAFAVAPTQSRVNKQRIQSVLNNKKLKASANTPGLTADHVYINAKVPFVYDYADKDSIVDPSAHNYGKLAHGTHVAGTVAGKDNADFRGVAPEAQLMIFKVFSDNGGGASDVSLVSALEDCVYLGVDVINMSLGSDAGYMHDAYKPTNDMYNRIRDNGIVLDVAAGNAMSSSEKNLYGNDLTLASDPDHGIVGSPSTYASPISVASVNNTKYRPGDKTIDPTQVTLSSFSSIGTTPNISIKPEISAPGAWIRSAMPRLNGQNYDEMSGTSMATPHVAGASALMKQYLNDKFGALTNIQKMELTNNLLMSTAHPIVQKDGAPQPVRKQGSGMMDINAAVKTPVYLSVDPKQTHDGSNRPKIELGDDQQKTGNYTLKFKITNIGNKTETYQITEKVSVPVIKRSMMEDHREYAFMTDDNRTADMNRSGPTSVTVKPNETKDISITVQLTQTEKNRLNQEFENGTYVEGFIQLSHASNPQVSIPFLAFYGDWERAPIFDHAAEYEMGVRASNYAHRYLSEKMTMGGNIFDRRLVHTNPSRFVLSPNGDGLYDKLTGINLGQLRNVEKMTMQITNKQTKQLVMREERPNIRKTFYNNNYGKQVPNILFWPFSTFTGLDQQKNPLPEGRYEIKISADLGYRPGVDQEIVHIVHIDTTKPVVPQDKIKFTEKNGKVMLHVESSDNTFLTQTALYPIYNGEVQVNRPLKKQYTPYDLVSRHAFDVDVTNLKGQEVMISAVDAGMLETNYKTTVPGTPSPRLKVDEFKIKVGEQVQLEPENFKWKEPTFESEEATIADVNDKGLVTGIEPGATFIVIKDKNDIDLVALIEVFKEEELEIQMKEGEKRQLTPYKLDGKLTFDSDAPHIVSARDTGEIEAHQKGKANILVQNAYEKVTYSVEVVDQPKYKPTLSFEQSRYEINSGDVITPRLIISNNDPNNPQVVTRLLTSNEEHVSVAGLKFTGEHAGEAAVIAELKNGARAVTKVKVGGLDTKKLDILISQASNLVAEDYTKTSMTSVTTVLGEAKALRKQKGADQSQIDAMTEKLKKALDSLVAVIKNLPKTMEVEVGSTFKLSPKPAQGKWVWDDSYLEGTLQNNDQDMLFKGIKEGQTDVRYRTKDGEEQTVTVTVKAKPKPVEIDPIVPEKPKDPVDPVVPEKPKDPVDPVVPEKPKDPVDPVVPEKPKDPVDPVVPEKPKDPVDPVVPEKPKDPVDPVVPEKPKDPVDPVVPEKPKDPVDPVVPVPEKPKDPVDPVVPEKPKDPVDPVVPEKPKDPVDPIVPEKPKDPVIPEKPKKPIDGGAKPIINKPVIKQPIVAPKEPVTTHPEQVVDQKPVIQFSGVASEALPKTGVSHQYRGFTLLGIGIMLRVINDKKNRLK
ncbi:S8 family serine peptidase [Erysipelothrix tonsillarum]|uniref:S8 family serine peptidase n=1 Tax=Erysipelothrix tonsillarum TaxID=38402 RepID=UPI0003635EB0|nr:S8 family serine peptidase [Erysipelothrix tonsillarum]